MKERFIVLYIWVPLNLPGLLTWDYIFLLEVLPNQLFNPHPGNKTPIWT